MENMEFIKKIEKKKNYKSKNGIKENLNLKIEPLILRSNS